MPFRDADRNEGGRGLAEQPLIRAWLLLLTPMTRRAPDPRQKNHAAALAVMGLYPPQLIVTDTVACVALFERRLS